MTRSFVVLSLLLPLGCSAIVLDRDGYTQAPDEISAAVDAFVKGGGKKDQAKAYWMHNVGKVKDKAAQNAKNIVEQRDSLSQRMLALGNRITKLEVDRKTVTDHGDRDKMWQQLAGLQEQKAKLGRQNAALIVKQKAAEAVRTTGHHQDLLREEGLVRERKLAVKADEAARLADEKVLRERQEAKMKAAVETEAAAHQEKARELRAVEEAETRKRNEERAAVKEREARAKRSEQYQGSLAKELEAETHRRKLAEKNARQINEELQAIAREKKAEEARDNATVAKAVQQTGSQLEGAEGGGDAAQELANTMQGVDPHMSSIFFKDMIGDVSMSSLGEMVKALKVVVKDSVFMANFTVAKNVMKEVGEEYTMLVQDRVLDFTRQANAAPEADFVPMLASFLAESEQVFLQHQRHTVGIAKMIKEAMPMMLRQHLAPIVIKMMPKMLPFTRNATFFTRLATTPAAEVCGQLSSLMEGVGHVSNLTQTKEMINATARAMPMLSAVVPDVNADVTGFVTSLIALGYDEVVALESTSREITENVAPLITDRLACTWRSAAAGARPGVFAAVLLAALATSRFIL